MRKNYMKNVNRVNQVNRVADANYAADANHTAHKKHITFETDRSSGDAKKKRRAAVDTILAMIKGTNLCAIMDNDENEPIVIAERVPYDVPRDDNFMKLQSYLRSYEELDKKMSQLATLLGFCRNESQIVMAADLEKIQHEFEVACDACGKRKCEIIGFISQLDSETDRRIFTKHYLYGYDFDAIGKQLGMREECVRLAHDIALEELYDIMNDAAAEVYMKACNSAVKASNTAVKASDSAANAQ